MRILISILLIFTVTVSINAQSNALDMDGANDHVVVPNGSSAISGSSGISMTFWAYPRASVSFPNYNGMAGFRNDTNADFYILQVSSTNLEARFRNSSGGKFDITQTAIALNQWQHYALTYDGTTLSFYRNNILFSSVSATGNISLSTEDLYLGLLKYGSVNYFFNGKIDDFTLWSKALTTTEIGCIYSYGVDTTKAGLELYYSCDQGIADSNNLTDTILHDHMGNIDGELDGFSLMGSSSNWVDGVSTINYSNVHICQGDSFLFGTKYISQPGNYRDYFSSQTTCDSIAEVTLFVHDPDTTTETITMCMGDSIEFDGQYLKNEGTYIATLPSKFGCDSMATLILDVDSVNLGISRNVNELVAAAQNALYQWYDCDGDTIMPGETNKIFLFPFYNSFSVIVTQNNCTDTSNCLLVSNIGIAESYLKTIKLFPNPAVQELTVSGISKTTVLTFYDLNMKAVLSKVISSDVKINISDLESGIYIVRMKSENQIETRKLVVL